MLSKFDELGKNIEKDLFSKGAKKELTIIDDYNINHDMSEQYMEELVDAISSVRDLKVVRIFIQNYKYPKTPAKVLLKSTDNTKIDKQIINLENKIKLVDLFRKKGIICYYVIYPYVEVRPPFHGRYWLSETNGYIVDGSICTTLEKLVLVQLMDEENFSIVMKMVTDIISPPNLRRNSIFARTELIDEYNKLLRKKASLRI